MIQVRSTSDQPPRFDRIAVEILAGLALTLTIAALLSYVEIALSGSSPLMAAQLNAVALLAQ
jgi:hypothetical protein